MYDADAANAGNAVAPAAGIWDTAPLNPKSILLPLSFTRATHLLEPLQHLAASSEGVVAHQDGTWKSWKTNAFIRR